MKKLRQDPTGANQPLSGLPILPVFSGRQMFMRYVGVTTATGLVMGACTDKIIEPLAGPGGGSTAGAREGDIIELGSGDVGVLNYAYALEQAELRFLELVTDNFYPGISEKERQTFIDFRNQKITHREFFKQVLGSQAVPTLTLDYRSVDFNSRDSVLATAAYNGAGQLLTNATNLGISGIIVSVEARHAAIVRELRGKKGYITGNSSPGVPSGVYDGDESTRHLEISSLSKGIPFENATQAWDEPLSKEDVLKIVAPFLAQ